MNRTGRSLLMRWCLCLPALTLVGLLAFVPAAFLVRMSFNEFAPGQGFYREGTFTTAHYAGLTRSFELRLIGFTLLFGLEIASLAVLLGFPVALYLRSLRPRWRNLALGAVLLPKVASTLVILFGLQRILGNSGPINQILEYLGIVEEPIQLYRNHFGALLGELYLVLPLSILVMAIQLLSVDSILEAAARGLGASSWQVFRHVTLPLALPGIFLAGELALIWGLGAFLGPLFLGSPEEATLSLEFFHQSFELLAWPRGAVMGTILLLLVLTSLMGYRLIQRLFVRPA